MYVLKEKIIYTSKPQRYLWYVNNWFNRLPRLLKINWFKKPELSSLEMIPVLGNDGVYLRIKYIAKNDYKALIYPIGEVTGKYDFLIKIEKQLPQNLQLIIYGLTKNRVCIYNFKASQFKTLFQEMSKSYPIDLSLFEEGIKEDVFMNTNLNAKLKDVISIKEYNISTKISESSKISIKTPLKINLASKLPPISLIKDLDKLKLTTKI